MLKSYDVSMQGNATLIFSFLLWDVPNKMFPAYSLLTIMVMYVCFVVGEAYLLFLIFFAICHIKSECIQLVSDPVRF